MSNTPHNPAFPFDFSALVEPGCVEVLTAVEVGVVWRLLKAAWARRGSLPGEAHSLAMVAGVDLQTWETLSSRVRWALAYDGNSCRYVVKAIEEAQQRVSATRAAKAAAGKAGADRRWRSQSGDPPPPTMAGDSTCHTRAMQVPSGAIPETPRAISQSPRAHAGAALERSEINTNHQRSSAQTVDQRDVLGHLHAGIDAKAAAALRPWQIHESRRLLMAAAERWLKQGKIFRRVAEKSPDGKVTGYRDVVADSLDIGFIVRLASHARTTPARMEMAIRRADKDSIEKPLGMVRNSLGAFDGGKTLEPYVSDVDLIDKWAQIERKIVDSEKAKAATTEALARIGSGGVQPMNEDQLTARRGSVLAQFQKARTVGNGASAS